MPNARRKLIIARTLGLICVANAATVAQNREFTPSATRYLVQYRDGAISTQSAFGATPAVQPGGWHPVVLAPGESIESLELRPDILRIEPDFVRTLPEASVSGAMQKDVLVDEQYGLDRIDAFRAWGVETGRSEIIVAVIDSGIDRNHPDLADRLWRNPHEELNGRDDDRNGYVDDLYGWDFVENDASPQDETGHGTHIAGTIAAVHDDNAGISGVANVSVMVLRVLDHNNASVDSRTIEAIRYAVDNGAHIINLSLGGHDYSRALEDACNAAAMNGVLLVAAVGNQGTSSVMYPARFKSVLGVGATNALDAVPTFSNKGEGIDLVAPGVNIVGTTIGGGYTYRSGTSTATPYVTGVAALLLSADPSLDIWTVRARLIHSAIDLGPAGWDPESGYGRLEAYTALMDGTIGQPINLAPPPEPSQQPEDPNAQDRASGRNENLGSIAPLVPVPCGAGLTPGMLAFLAVGMTQTPLARRRCTQSPERN